MILKELLGNSGSKIFLIEENNKVFVRKIGDVKRNFERLTALEKYGLPVSKVLDYKDNILDIEYIHGIDMCSYLIKNNSQNLSDFLIDVLGSFSTNKKCKNYKDVYSKKLNQYNFDNLPISKFELLTKLPEIIPSSQYHGDLTLENIIYSKTRGFVLIDAVTIEYDSYLFDIAKLKQDLICKWFLRNKNINLDIKLQEIDSSLDKKFGPLDPSFLIAMLLRVYVRNEQDANVKKFLENAMRSLCIM